jgi:cell division protein ZapE
MISPLKSYEQAIQSGQWQFDPNQLAIMGYFQRIYEAVLQDQPIWSIWIQLIFRLPHRTHIQGLYLWGGVGIGKTGLMDIFFQSLPLTVKKLRLHFHRFMRQVHQDLTLLQGQVNPLNIVAERFAQQARVLCFDEFMVSDIADAMILAQLLDELFKRGMILVVTSNTAPDELYRNGLQRQQFLPAIDLLKQHNQVVHIQTTIDYRLRALESAGVYFYPLNSQTEQAMLAQFNRLAQGRVTEGQAVVIEQRPIESVRYTEDIAWFDFDQLCQVPRSQVDYLEIARNFSTIFLSRVPKISPESDNLITYLIQLVDIFYDARVKLIISAVVPVEEIYTAGRFHQAFTRTQSRLLEMQSHHYLGLTHLG